MENQILFGTNENDNLRYKWLRKIFEKYVEYLIKLRENFEGKNSPKLEKLIEVIKNKEELENKQMTILIFVDKRMIAKYMNSILKLYFEKRAGYIIGQSHASEKGKINEESGIFLEKKVSKMPNKNEIKEIFERNRVALNETLINKKIGSGLNFFLKNKYSLNQQKAVIEHFKNKTIDFLVSTSVTEEGFDVPNCNLVIAYDDVKTIRSYIQLKGRARKENSEFLLFSPKIIVILLIF